MLSPSGITRQTPVHACANSTTYGPRSGLVPVYLASLIQLPSGVATTTGQSVLPTTVAASEQGPVPTVFEISTGSE